MKNYEALQTQNLELVSNCELEQLIIQDFKTNYNTYTVLQKNQILFGADDINKENETL